MYAILNNRKKLWRLGILILALGICGTIVAVNFITSMRDIGYDLNPSWGSDGQTLVFECYKPSLREVLEVRAADIPYSIASAEICTVSSDGQVHRRLTNNRSSDYGPVWAPDGSQIAFISNRDGSPWVYVMSADGTSQRRLAEGSNHIEWSPDGSQIAYWRYYRNEGGAYVIDLETGEERLLHKGVVFHIDWAPDGQAVALVTSLEAGCRIYIVEPNTGQQITSALPSACESTAWSRDGRMLAWIAERTYFERALMLLDRPTLVTTELITGEELIPGTLLWTRNGREILYLSMNGNRSIKSIAIDDALEQWTVFQHESLLTFAGNGDFSLSTDEKELAFVLATGDNGNGEIWKLNIDEMALTRLSQHTSR